ncbi:MAG: alpha-ribazole phosphatase [Deltaproteobacteria bacterium]|nr:alpha-ribazole phosphatase [Deltaproteobacteria bacterium]
MERRNRLYLVRHGQVVGHDGYQANGHTDVDITEVGRLQMEKLAERLRFISLAAIYSSDLKRTRLGAQIIAKYHDVKHHILEDLREMFFGDWEGMPLKEIGGRFPEELEERQKDMAGFRPPGNGESMRDLAERVIPCLQKILEQEKGREILIVAHGGVNRVILCHALKLDLNNVFHIHQNYGCLNIIDYFQDAALVRLMNG